MLTTHFMILSFLVYKGEIRGQGLIGIDISLLEVSLIVVLDL